METDPRVCHQEGEDEEPLVIALVRSVMCALMPSGGPLPGLAETGIDEFLPRFRREAAASVWIGVVAGSVLFVIFPLFTIGVPLPSFWLPAKLRDRYIQKITSHPLYHVRQLIFLVKMAAGLCWGAHPAVRAQLNLAPYPADPGTWRTT